MNNNRMKLIYLKGKNKFEKVIDRSGKKYKEII